MPGRSDWAERSPGKCPARGTRPEPPESAEFVDTLWGRMPVLLAPPSDDGWKNAMELACRMASSMPAFPC